MAQLIGVESPKRVRLGSKNTGRGNPGHRELAPTDPGHAILIALESGAESISAALLIGARIAAVRTTARDQWEALATLASLDLGVARAIEPVIDAANILREAGSAAVVLPPHTTWGVFAAEGGSNPLLATETPTGWRISGIKPWCSLAGQLDAALVTAKDATGAGYLFSIDLTADGVTVDTGAWQSRGLVEIPSGPVSFTEVAAVPIGDAGWYLSRPGFAIGGIGVAACWFGGAVGIARTIFASLTARQPGDLQLMHLGAVDELLRSCRLALSDAASVVDEGAASPAELAILAKRTRATVARASEEIISRAGHALGPSPLALDADHAKRVADLMLYLRQHHAEKDEASLGRALVTAGVEPW